MFWKSILMLDIFFVLRYTNYFLIICSVLYFGNQSIYFIKFLRFNRSQRSICYISSEHVKKVGYNNNIKTAQRVQVESFSITFSLPKSCKIGNWIKTQYQCIQVSILQLIGIIIPPGWRKMHLMFNFRLTETSFYVYKPLDT